MDILKEVKEIVQSNLPKETQVTNIEMEGPEVAIYTRNPKAFFENENFVAKIAFELKKRVNIRTDKSLLSDELHAKEVIKELVPEGAGIKEIYFNPSFSEVVIEAIKPGLVIGKGGETSKEIILKTGWTPNILRSPTSNSEILKGIRHHLHKYSSERKKILQETAKKIYRELAKNNGWVRMTALGGFREVGKSCVMIETPETKVLLDVGVDVANQEQPYPYLEAIRFPLDQLDAVVISHAHLDHAGLVPLLFKMGYRGPVYTTKPTRDLMALLQFDFIDVLVKEGKEPPYTERDVKEMLKYCITREYREVTDIAPDMRITLHNAAHILGSASVHFHIGEGAHNLVYSLDWKTPITAFDKKGNVKIIEIGKLVDREINKFGIGNGFVEEASNLSGWKTIAFNPQTLKAETVDISSFIRHPINEDLFEISTKTGRKTVVTGSHSVFTVKNSNVESIQTKDLKLGDYIVGSKRLEIEGKKIVIKLPKSKFALKLTGKELEEKIEKTLEKAKKYFPKKQNEVMIWVKDHFESGLYENAIARKHKVSRKTVRKYFQKLGIEKNPRVKNVFRQEIEITNDLARFIGYFVAEGSINKNTVSIPQNDRKILQDCLDVIENTFGIKGKIVRKEAQFYSKQLSILLKDVLKCGTSAYTKRIPNQLALAEKKITSEFLKGYFIGDGWIRIRNKGASISCASKSKFLIEEIAFLLLRLGITPTFEYNKTSKMHNLHVYGRDQLNLFLNNIQVTKWRKKLSLRQEHKLKSHFANKIPIQALSEQTQQILSNTAWQNAKSCGTSMLMKISQSALEKKLVESDLILDEIKSIKKVHSTNKFVYDLSVKGYENFLGGNGHLFMHNSGDIKFGFTRLFNNVDINYPRLETLIVESTYGGKDDLQQERNTAEEQLISLLKETMHKNGNTLIPVFSVGRAQEIMLVIEEYYRKGMLDGKVFVDGMTKEASAIHTAYPEYLRKGVQRRVLQNDSPFTSELFQLANGKERDKILEEKGAIIIASSGMLTGGPSVEYFQKMADNPNNTLIFVGYQGEGSLGSRIQKGLRRTPITDNGKTRELPVNMWVETVDGFSGHSYRNQLINYIRNLNPKPKKIIVNHGEKDTAIEFARYVSNKFRINATAIRDLDSVRLK